MDRKINSQNLSLPAELASAVESTLKEWEAKGNVARLWAGDPGLWTGADEDKWLGWLNIAGEQQKTIRRFTNFAAEVRDGGFRDLLLLGMGGSSLCPEVLRKSFGQIAGFPELYVLDSTDPAQVKSFADKIDLTRTLFIVSSKSGTTLEPNIFQQYFFERCRQAIGGEDAGSRFIAITDPGSKLRQRAEKDQFRKVFLGVPSIGGRYSALSDFGLAPAAAMGIDVERFLARANEMVLACGPDVTARNNPGVILGCVLGVAHNQGRNKVTMVASAAIYDLGAWLEQLLAESTGKNGKGLIPVDREPLAAPDRYGDDRVFVYLRHDAASDASQDAAMAAIRDKGFPVVTIAVGDVYDLGQEFFRWEIATAVAGAIVRINPFDQPDVEASKVATRKLTEEYEQTGSLPSESPFFESGGIKLFADEKNQAALSPAGSLTEILQAHLNRLGPGDYFALLAYLEMNEQHQNVLQQLRATVRDAKRVATCVGFGPRFLHSTGQAYKGGPNQGVFLQLTCDDPNDLPVPDQKYSFGVVKAAQARGDFQVLNERGRRALRIHLGTDINADLKMLSAGIEEALRSH